MAKDGLQVLMRYLTLYGEVIDRRAPHGDRPRVHGAEEKEESAQLLQLATALGRDPDNEELRTAALRSALRLANIKGDQN